MSLYLNNATLIAETVYVTIPSQILMPWKVGKRYDFLASHGGGTTTTTVVANTMYAFRLIPVCETPGATMTLSAMDFRISAVAAGGKGRLALYTNGSNFLPDQLIAQTVEQALDVGPNTTVDDATFAATVTDQVPVWAIYWGNGAPTLIAAASGGNEQGIPSSVQGGSIYPGISVASTYTAGVSTFPTTAPTGWAPDTKVVNLSVKRGS